MYCPESVDLFDQNCFDAHSAFIFVQQECHRLLCTLTYTFVESSLILRLRYLGIFLSQTEQLLVASLLNSSHIKLCSISHWFEHPSHIYVSLQMLTAISALCYIEGGKNLTLIRHLYDQITTC